MHIYLVRHGQSVGNLNELLYGSTDYPLTDLGQAQAQEVGEKLRGLNIKKCWSSPLIRAADTARICLGDENIPIEYDDRLMEQDMGVFEGQPFWDMMEKYPKAFGGMMENWVDNPPPDGESFDVVSQRVSTFAQQIRQQNEDVLIVAHNGPLSILTAQLLGMDKHCVESLYFSHGCYSSLLVDDPVRRRNILECFNK